MYVDITLRILFTDVWLTVVIEGKYFENSDGFCLRISISDCLNRMLILMPGFQSAGERGKL